MAHQNEREYLRRFLATWPLVTAGRVLETGSAQYGDGSLATSTYQRLFDGREIVGVDLAPHAGVSVVCDLEGDASELKNEQFAAVLCTSVLEHTKRPWLVAATLLRHLAPDGLLYITVPWIWRHHSYPKDYWRLSVDGVKVLFPQIRWKRIAYATQKGGEFLTEAQAGGGLSWVRDTRGSRVFLTSQLVCMIGRQPGQAHA